MKTSNLETKVLKGSILFLMITALLMTTVLFTSCESNSTEEVIEDDTDLITAIEGSANRTLINVEDLPSTAQSELASEFSNDVIYEVASAEGLGFEVRLITTEGSWASEFNRAYFNTSGRLLEDRNRPRHGRRRSCFHIVFPFSVTMPDGSTITLESREDKSLIREWYQANPDEDDKPSLVYPIEIEYQDGTIVTVNSQEELIAAREGCKTTRCFDLVYPFGVTMPDGTVITLNSEDDRTLIREWYQNNPGVHERPTLVFPVDIIYEDGTIQTINNEDELQTAKDNC